MDTLNEEETTALAAPDTGDDAQAIEPRPPWNPPTISEEGLVYRSPPGAVGKGFMASTYELTLEPAEAMAIVLQENPLALLRRPLRAAGQRIDTGCVDPTEASFVEDEVVLTILEEQWSFPLQPIREAVASAIAAHTWDLEPLLLFLMALRDEPRGALIPGLLGYIAELHARLARRAVDAIPEQAEQLETLLGQFRADPEDSASD